MMLRFWQLTTVLTLLLLSSLAHAVLESTFNNPTTVRKNTYSHAPKHYYYKPQQRYHSHKYHRSHDRYYAKKHYNKKRYSKFYFRSPNAYDALIKKYNKHHRHYRNPAVEQSYHDYQKHQQQFYRRLK